MFYFPTVKDYFYSSAKRNYGKALNACADKAGGKWSLAMPRVRDEAEAVKALLNKKADKKADVWIGLNDKKAENVFAVSDTNVCVHLLRFSYDNCFIVEVGGGGT